MRVTRRAIQWMTLSACAAALLMVSGCSKSRENDERVEAANNRWLAMRSAMMMEMGEQQFEAGDLTQAERTIRDAIQMDPERARLWVLAGRIELEHSRLERAGRLFRQAIELDEEDPHAHYYMGLVLQRWRRYEQAHEHYARAFELEPYQQGYLLASVEMLVELNRMQDAIDELEQRLDYFDHSSGIRAALGHLYMKQGFYEQAVNFFEDAATLSPENKAFRQELAMARVAAGHTERAIRLLNELLEDSELAGRRDLRRALAEAYWQQGSLDLAREHYLHLARGARGDASDWIRLAELAWEQEQYNDALFAAERAMREAPRAGDGHMIAGLVYFERGDVEQAVGYLERAAELTRDSNEPLILLGVALQRLGRGAEAARAYETALEREPNDERAQRLLHQVNY